MIPLKDTQFTVTDYGDGLAKGKFVRGRLVISCEMLVTGHAPSDMIEEAKDRIGDTIWHHVYGELLNPLYELEMLALRYAPFSGTEEVRARIAEISALLGREVDKPASGLTHNEELEILQWLEGIRDGRLYPTPVWRDILRKIREKR